MLSSKLFQEVGIIYKTNMDRQEAKDFVIKTLNQGNRERIQEVLKRYFVFIKTAKQETIVEAAERIFNV